MLKNFQTKLIKDFYKDNHVYSATGLSFRLFLKEIDKNYFSRTEFVSQILSQILCNKK